MSKCHVCATPLPLDGARPCAILICAECRKQHEALRLTREAMNRHLAEHKIEYQRTQPYWPFRDWFEAAAHKEAA